ncbi:MAG: tRNA lysidine(34) synthetase TilS [Anaerolineales bacterium]|nr:tRNA lysidine(34) synthetase TilS [Anaerolineales bacterium]
MSENFEAILAGECGLVKDRITVVGVSGGPDSLCLMEMMRRAGYPILVAYFDHQLRPESSTDARMVEKTASRLMLGCFIDGADVRSFADERKMSIEEAARTLRYRFLFDLARRQKAQAVAVGHTADDQVETVLMHFLRGSGISGLKGMSYRSIIKSFDPDIPVVRPMLDMWREETVLYCAVNGLRPHYDSSNDSVSFQRNRIRHLLMPTLETYNPKFREATLHMSQSLKSDYAFVMETLERAWGETVLSANDELVTFDAARLLSCSVGLQRNLVKHAMQNLNPGVDVSFQTLERATQLINSSQPSSRADLKAGLRIFREENYIHICTSNAVLPFDRWPQMPGEAPLSISLPGQVTLAGGWKLTCERWRLPALAKEQADGNDDPFQVWLDAEELKDTFTLRVRHQGDHFTPLGLDGHSQKLSDFFVNEKLPQRARDRWPLLCAGDEIIWVPGHRPAHRHRLKATTRDIIYFSVVHPPEKLAPDENSLP